MIHFYQPFLLPFLRWKRTPLAQGVERRYYHSFEDGLWDLLQQLKIPKRSLILLPDFYCLDVVENIENHGYKTAIYPLDHNFQIKAKLLESLVAELKPAVVVIFHAAGISNRAVDEVRWWKTFSEELVVIEDMVHRLVNPSKVSLRHRRHFWMDSLRKVSPLPGSFLYGQHLWPIPRKMRLKIDHYWLASWWWYFWFKLSFGLSQIINVTALAAFAHNYFLKKHDEVIGDHQQAHGGVPFFGWLNHYVDFDKVAELKQQQVKTYKAHLQHVFSNSQLFYEIAFTPEDYNQLHVYPLGWRKAPNPKLECFLQSRGMAIWFKFADSPWSKDKGVLFLPLGFHISPQDIAHISLALWEYENLSD